MSAFRNSVGAFTGETFGTYGVRAPQLIVDTNLLNGYQSEGRKRFEFSLDGEALHSLRFLIDRMLANLEDDK